MYFSVIIPFFNKSATVESCIYSVLNQTFRGFEIILIDDCSSESESNFIRGLVENLNQNFDARIRYILNKENKGPGYSRNVGIDQSIGDILVFLDADDQITPNYLESIDNLYHKYQKPIIISNTIEKIGGFVRPNFINLYKKGLISIISENVFATNDFVGAFCEDPIFCGCANVAILKGPINGIRFNEIDRNFEDWLFFYEVCSRFPDGIIFMKSNEGVIYNNEISDSLSRRKVNILDIQIPSIFSNGKIDNRFTRFIYFNWLYSCVKRLDTFENRIKFIIKYFKSRFYLPTPILRFLIPTILLIFNFEKPVIGLAKFWKKLKYDN
ncbi:MAG: hypothetical protein RL638_226 [Bacteroidota bacterium]